VSPKTICKKVPGEILKLDEGVEAVWGGERGRAREKKMQ